MNLGKAATWFSDTKVSGWNGSAWVPNVAAVTMLPHDRFISEREFGNKRRYVLCAVESTGLEAYPVIRFDDVSQTYMVGSRNFDIQVDAYSKLFLLHQVQYTATLYQFSKTTTASGMAGTVTRQSLGNVFCDVERITSASSYEFQDTNFTSVVITLPRDSVADTDHELKVGSDYYDIREAYASAGFRHCRAIRKKSA